MAESVGSAECVADDEAEAEAVEDAVAVVVDVAVDDAVVVDVAVALLDPVEVLLVLLLPDALPVALELEVDDDEAVADADDDDVPLADAEDEPEPVADVDEHGVVPPKPSSHVHTPDPSQEITSPAVRRRTRPAGAGRSGPCCPSAAPEIPARSLAGPGSGLSAEADATPSRAAGGDAKRRLPTTSSIV